MRIAEKARATEGIQSVEEGGSALWQARAWKRFCIHFSRSSIPKKSKNVFWGSFGGEKINLKKNFWFRTFKGKEIQKVERSNCLTI